MKTSIGPHGRLHVPKEFRDRLGLKEGSEVIVGVHDGAIRVETREAAIGRAQKMVRERLARRGGDAAGEGSQGLSRDRRSESRREGPVG